MTGGTLLRAFIRHKSVSFITVEDVKTGVALRIAQLVVAVYAFIQVFRNKEYMLKETPRGYSNTWVERFAGGTLVVPEYCNNSKYDFQYDALWSYNDNLCRDFYYGQVINKLENGGMYIQTYTQDTISLRQGCKDDGTGCAQKSANTTNVFTLGVDDIEIGVGFSYATDFLQGASPATTLVDSEGNKIQTFDQGVPVKLTLSEALRLAGIDSLDAKNELAYVADSSGHASYRLTGLQLFFEFDLTNLDSFDWKATTAQLKIKAANTGWVGKGGKADILQHTQLEDGTTTISAVDTYSYGIKIQTETIGKLGTPDVGTTIGNLVTYSVLLGFAGLVADFVAAYGTDSSTAQVFKAKKKELINPGAVAPKNH